MDTLARAQRTHHPFDLQALDSSAWAAAPPLTLAHDWSGRPAPRHRHAQVHLLWNEHDLLVRFDCAQGEPLVSRAEPQRDRKVMGLWDHDVGELFVAPEAAHPEHYFEFEVAPTGEWLDVELRWFPDRRDSDWGYASAMRTAARVEPSRVLMAMAIPWSALGGAPQPGEIWLCNLFRCVGPNDLARGYLAWQPTHTPQPAFHVPRAFAPLRFDA